MGTKLPRKLEQKMSVVGEQIKLARLRRNLSVAQVAERATCSSWHIDHSTLHIQHSTISNFFRNFSLKSLADMKIKP